MSAFLSKGYILIQRHCLTACIDYNAMTYLLELGLTKKDAISQEKMRQKPEYREIFS